MQNILNTIKKQVLIIGSEGVGKTSLVRKYVDNKFTKNYIPTIGSDFSLKNEFIQSKDKNNEKGVVKILLKIFDIGGQPEFEKNMIRYAKTSDVIIACYDCTDYSSFNNLINLIAKIKKEVTITFPMKTIMVVATKSDLLIDHSYQSKSRSFLDNERMKHDQIPIFQLEQMTLLLEATHAFETSSLYGNNIKDLFSNVGKFMYNSFIHYEKLKNNSSKQFALLNGFLPIFNS